VIAGTGYIKSANNESLARDEGGGRNLFTEIVTYKTVHGDCNIFFPSVDAAARRDWRALKGSTC
jgi:hypothetical protein